MSAANNASPFFLQQQQPATSVVGVNAGRPTFLQPQLLGRGCNELVASLPGQALVTVETSPSPAAMPSSNGLPSSHAVVVPSFSEAQLHGGDLVGSRDRLVASSPGQALVAVETSPSLAAMPSSNGLPSSHAVVVPSFSAGNVSVVNFLPAQPRIGTGSVATAQMTTGQPLLMVPVNTNVSPKVIPVQIISDSRLIGVQNPLVSNAPAPIRTSNTTIASSPSAFHSPPGGQIFIQQAIAQRPLNQATFQQQSVLQQTSTPAVPLVVAVGAAPASVQSSSLVQQQHRFQQQNTQLVQQQRQALHPIVPLASSIQEAAVQDVASRSRQQLPSSQRATNESRKYPDEVTSNNPVGNSDVKMAKNNQCSNNKKEHLFNVEQSNNSGRERSIATDTIEKEERPSTGGGKSEGGQESGASDGCRNTRDSAWNEMYQRLVKYKEVHGNCHVPARYEQDKKLGSWVHNQRILRKKSSRYPEKRIRNLEELGFKWSMNDDVWETKYERLVEYKRVHGTKDHHDFIFPSQLGTVPTLQILILDFHLPLSLSAHELLDSGHCFVPQRCNEDESLGYWAHNQRTRKHIMCAERRKKLERLNFFETQSLPQQRHSSETVRKEEEE